MNRNKELIYEQATGKLWLNCFTHCELLENCYAGAPGYVNNPDAEALEMRGPIPRGLYRVDPPIHHRRLGPVSLYLHPLTDIGGRAGFFIHGDNTRGDRSASHGCIIASRKTRSLVARFAPLKLRVIREVE